MKVRSLCIMLALLIIFLLSTAVHATEYREFNKKVNASDVIRHIENGDDVNLDNCRVVGELNVSHVSVIESNITIGSSIFEDSLIFPNVLFEGSVNFGFARKMPFLSDYSFRRGIILAR